MVFTIKLVGLKPVNFPIIQFYDWTDFSRETTYEKHDRKPCLRQVSSLIPQVLIGLVTGEWRVYAQISDPFWWNYPHLTIFDANYPILNHSLPSFPYVSCLRSIISRVIQLFSIFPFPFLGPFRGFPAIPCNGQWREDQGIVGRQQTEAQDLIGCGFTWPKRQWHGQNVEKTMEHIERYIVDMYIYIFKVYVNLPEGI